MRRPYVRLGTACALAVATTIFAGSALADNGNGNANGNATAPGQLKKEQTAQAQQSTSMQAEVQATASVNASATTTSGSAAGVKPSDSTAKWTHCVTGGTSSNATCTAVAPTPNTKPDVSKRYGNGKTAAQIAVGRGASAVTLTGPGNSQPHKVSDCRHKTNRSGGVDVHAVKSYSVTCQAATTPQTVRHVTSQTTVQTSAQVQQTTQVQQSAAVQQQSSSLAPKSNASTPLSTPAPQGGVLGAQTNLSAPRSNGAVQGTSLPFTGFPVWWAAVIGLLLLGAGLALVRRSGHAARL